MIRASLLFICFAGVLSAGTISFHPITGDGHARGVFFDEMTDVGQGHRSRLSHLQPTAWRVTVEGSRCYMVLATLFLLSF